MEYAKAVDTLCGIGNGVDMTDWRYKLALIAAAVYAVVHYYTNEVCDPNFEGCTPNYNYPATKRYAQSWIARLLRMLMCIVTLFGGVFMLCLQTHGDKGKLSVLCLVLLVVWAASVSGFGGKFFNQTDQTPGNDLDERHHESEWVQFLLWGTVAAGMIAYATTQSDTNKGGLYYPLFWATLLAVCFEILQFVLLALGSKHGCYNESDVQGDEQPLKIRHGLSMGFGIVAFTCLALPLIKSMPSGTAAEVKEAYRIKTATATPGNTEI